MKYLLHSTRMAAFVNNVTGTRTLAEAAAAAGVEKFVMISTDCRCSATAC